MYVGLSVNMYKSGRDWAHRRRGFITHKTTKTDYHLKWLNDCDWGLPAEWVVVVLGWVDLKFNNIDKRLNTIAVDAFPPRCLSVGHCETRHGPKNHCLNYYKFPKPHSPEPIASMTLLTIDVWIRHSYDDKWIIHNEVHQYVAVNYLLSP